MSIERTVAAPAWLPSWQIEFLSDFMKFIEHNCQVDLVLYRGQRQDWPLVPKIARVKTRGDVLLQEQRMLSSFKREALPHLTSKPPANDWDWLALAQHHGLPTRMLDWTTNSLTALWFAVCEPSAAPNTPAVVWVYCPGDEEHVEAEQLEDSPLLVPETKTLRSNLVSPRISAQNAVFTIHPYMNRFVALVEERHSGLTGHPNLQRVFIPAARFSRLRFDLDACGVNASKLFPDVDGVARHIQWSYTVLDDEISPLEPLHRLPLVRSAAERDGEVGTGSPW